MTDTSPTAAGIQIRVLRGLTPERRLELALEMSLAARALLVARLQAEHPEWPAEQLTREALRLSLPDAAWPPQLG